MKTSCFVCVRERTLACRVRFVGFVDGLVRCPVAQKLPLNANRRLDFCGRWRGCFIDRNFISDLRNCPPGVPTPFAALSLPFKPTYKDNRVHFIVRVINANIGGLSPSTGRETPSRTADPATVIVTLLRLSTTHHVSSNVAIDPSIESRETTKSRHRERKTRNRSASAVDDFRDFVVFAIPPRASSVTSRSWLATFALRGTLFAACCCSNCNCNGNSKRSERQRCGELHWMVVRAQQLPLIQWLAGKSVER